MTRWFCQLGAIRDRPGFSPKPFEYSNNITEKCALTLYEGSPRGAVGSQELALTKSPWFDQEFEQRLLRVQTIFRFLPDYRL